MFLQLLETEFLTLVQVPTSVRLASVLRSLYQTDIASIYYMMEKTRSESVTYRTW